jgi:hypothetical protein
MTLSLCEGETNAVDRPRGNGEGIIEEAGAEAHTGWVIGAPEQGTVDGGGVAPPTTLQRAVDLPRRSGIPTGRRRGRAERGTGNNGRLERRGAYSSITRTRWVVQDEAVT